MNRLLIITALLLIFVIAGERYVEHHVESERVLKSQLRRLPGNEDQTGDLVREFRIESADTAWTYRFKNGNWHYPAYENAFALNDRIKSFVKELVESYGTVVSTKTLPNFGIDANALTVHLTDSTKTWKQTIQIGASLPGSDTREAYMKVPLADTVYQIHADPVRGLHWERRPNTPPFIDPKILPTALSRRAMKQVVYHTNSHPIQQLDRVEIEPEKDKQSPTDGPIYDWFATFSNKRQSVVNRSVYAYLGYLSRLKYTELHDSTQMPQSEKYVVLIDDQDTADTLDIGVQASNTLVRHRTTGHLYSLPNNKANLLFPTPTVLDTLPDPSPYQIAEPTGPFSLTSP
jgi:hypothetical protein